MRLPPLHVVATDRVAAEADAFLARARALRSACREGLALHLRLKEAGGRRLHRLAETLARQAAEEGGWCVVNERVDVALAAGAQAVQLGRDGLPLPVARRLAGEEAILGASVHAEPQARAAAGDGANYLLLGTIFPTPSHPGRAGAGPELIAACRDVGPPVVAIGGIDRDRVPAVRDAGAAGVAAVRAVWDAPEPVTAARDLLDALEGEQP